MCASLPAGAPWASMPTASMTESGPRPSVSSRTAAGTSSTALTSTVANAVPLRARQALGHEIEADHRAGAEMLGDPRGHLADRSQPDDRDAAAVGDLRVLHGLPGGGQDVGQEEEAVVGRPFGDLDGAVMGLGHAQELGLPTGHLPVELGVAEEAGPHALVAVLRRLALRLQAVLAHEAMSARDVERHDDAIADREIVDPRADGLDDAHRLVAEHVTGVEKRPHHLVEVQVRAAQAGRGDADDRVGRLLDGRVGDVVDADVAPAMPGQCLHAVALPESARPRFSGHQRRSRTTCPSP